MAASEQRNSTIKLTDAIHVKAPDGSDVGILCQAAGGSMAHFSLPPGATAQAVMHRTVDEIWYVIQGIGEMWQEQEGRETTIALKPGVSLTILQGTKFQFRNTSSGVFAAVAITMPPWPGQDEAIIVDGPWPASTS